MTIKFKPLGVVLLLIFELALAGCYADVVTLKMNSKYYALDSNDEYYELHVVREKEDTLFLMSSDRIGRLPVKVVKSIDGNYIYLSSYNDSLGSQMIVFETIGRNKIKIRSKRAELLFYLTEEEVNAEEYFQMVQDIDFVAKLKQRGDSIRSIR